MTTASFNRFSVLNEMADNPKPGKKETTSPPTKKVKKRTPVGSDSSGNKIGSEVKVTKGKSRRRVVDRSGSSDGPIKPNRRLVLSDSDSDLKENKVVQENNEVLAPTPPDIEKTTCPATDFYVGLARNNHHIPTLDELLDKAGSFGRMFEEGNPLGCLGSDILNLDELYGMRRQRFQERKLMWQAKASLIFFEQGLIQQVFEREKVVLFFHLIVKHKDRVPNLYRMYNSLYDLEKPVATE